MIYKLKLGSSRQYVPRPKPKPEPAPAHREAPGSLVAAVADAIALQKQGIATDPHPEEPEEFVRKTVCVRACHFQNSDLSADRSPVALAIRERLRIKPETRVCVWIHRVRIGERCFELPADCNTKESHFRRTGDGEPFEFEICNKEVEP